MIFSTKRLLELTKKCGPLKAVPFAAIATAVLLAGSGICGTQNSPDPGGLPDVQAETTTVPRPKESKPENTKKTRIHAPKQETPAEPPEPEETGETADDSFEFSEELDEMLDEILEEIITDGMTKQEQAYAVFRYTNKRVRYIDTSTKDSWQAGAYEGLCTGKGDCYTYYALSRALLTALDIDNLEVTRVGGTDSHYWNLVNCGDGWYHFDAGPHSVSMPGASFFMFTDEDAAKYTQRAGRSYYSFDASLYPERAVEAAAYNPLRDAPKKKKSPAAPAVETPPEETAPETELPEPAELPEEIIPETELSLEEPAVQEPEPLSGTEEPTGPDLGPTPAEEPVGEDAEPPAGTDGSGQVTEDVPVETDSSAEEEPPAAPSAGTGDTVPAETPVYPQETAA